MDYIQSIKLAILMTCHNRRDTTLRCLKALYQQDINFDVYLVDDGSSDGTYDAVSTAYPEVKILQGNGNLFWVGGMRLAFSEAIKRGYDYYLWLNDDIVLESTALHRLLNSHYQLKQQLQPDSIIVGSTKDTFTHQTTYGGQKQQKRWYSRKFVTVEAGTELQECETMNGNCVLIPNSVVVKVGNLDPAFIHIMGDLDYGLRARKQGCSIWIAPGFIATCSRNSVRGSWADTKLSLLQRLRKVTQPKAFPLKSWTVFTRRHAGFFWWLYWLQPYIRAIIGYQDLSASAFKEG
ncbi:glycosyltransferase family 2 protein [Nostoc sp. CENA67]|uniref:Glycosyltransferase family 2 protein n=1 Tax=Amazonocrinis nigriterrae CENA67 TaxID=2794033 RepID=A0A8J7LB39_9NOST|nr:glycosyltransferase family 2 protein [Amazonocrinis nigriterrae]MBH8566258.1 glycosyltransferase family 2 protein [Amazonocrinis nigriterrae CENA67]